MLSEGRREIKANEQRLAAANERASAAKKTMESARQVLESAKKNVESARENVDSCNEEVKAAEAQLKEACERWQVIEVEDDADDELSAAAALPKRRKVSRRGLLLVGTLAYSDRDNLRRHVIRGNWKFERPSSPPEPFELIRFIPPEEDLRELPKDGEFNGSFNVRSAVNKTLKGKVKLKTRAVPESGVKLTFRPREDGSEGIFDVHGTGLNEFGTFELYGTVTKNSSIVEEDPTYKVSVHKRYFVVAPAPTPAQPAATTAIAGEAESNDKKQNGGDEARPPPTVLPTGGICLRGTLVRNTFEELSLDNTVVHRIVGLWSPMGLNVILDEPHLEYEHKCSGDSPPVFPLSGRYRPVGRAKVAERDITLEFVLNSDGYHNVKGRGKNVHGKYSITGALMEDGTITLCIHFQAIKLKASRKSANAEVGSNGSNSSTVLPDAGAQAAALVTKTSSSHAIINQNTSFGEFGSSGDNDASFSINQEKKEKERFLMYTRVLMKYLEQRDVNMHAAAKAQIKECYEKNKSGDPQFRSLTASMKAHLRSTVGEFHWKEANTYLDHFLKEKREAHQRKSPAVGPGESAQRVNKSRSRGHQDAPPAKKSCRRVDDAGSNNGRGDV